MGPGAMSMCFGTMDPNNADVARQQHGRRRQVISDEIRATLVHHVLIHGRTMKEAGQLVQPNLSRYTVPSIVRTFRRENRTERRPSIGRRRRLLTAEQETALVNMRIFELDAMADPHECIFIDEAGFNLTKRRKRGRNILGHHAVTQVPGQRGGNITICAAISNRGVLYRHAKLGPYNTARFLQFLNQLHDNILQQEGEPGQPEQVQYVVIWNNMSFHRAALVHTWFNAHPRFTVLFLPAYSPFLNLIEEYFFSQHGGGKCRTATPTYTKTSWKQCWMPVEMCLWSL